MPNCLQSVAGQGFLCLSEKENELKARPDLDIEVQGHTDNVGTNAYNQKLSEARAQSIMKWLIEHGIPARRLTSKGYGKGKPVDSNDTATGRARNRRVELAWQKIIFMYVLPLFGLL